MVCYCLHITEANPHESSLLFERFISRERNEPPDIDVDFEHQRREEVIQYIYAKYGRERAATAQLTAALAALRESFEELGVLHALHADGRPLAAAELASMRRDHRWPGVRC